MEFGISLALSLVWGGIMANHTQDQQIWEAVIKKKNIKFLQLFKHTKGL